MQFELSPKHPRQGDSQALQTFVSLEKNPKGHSSTQIDYKDITKECFGLAQLVQLNILESHDAQVS